MADPTFKASTITTREAWRTPGINPNAEESFTPFAITNKGFFDIVDYAHNNSISQFPQDNQKDVERDAYRHLLWTAMMTNKYGESTARLAGKVHESVLPIVGSPFQSKSEKKMDLYNNELGIEI